MIKNKKQNTKGFTLIELIVVMAVFLFVIGAAISIFISVVQHQKKVLSEQELLNQISYTEEHMSKALRMAKKEVDETCLVDSLEVNHPGYIYLLTRPDDAGFYRGIKFINQSEIDADGNPACQEFFWDTDGILKEIKNDGLPVALTSNNLTINFVRFGINGTDGSIANSPKPDSVTPGAAETDSPQPRVTILLGVRIEGDNSEPEKIIQTTASQRNLNVK